MGVMKRQYTAGHSGGSATRKVGATSSIATGKSNGKLVVVTGFKELDAKLGALPEALQKKFLRGALRKGGKRLARDVVQIIKAEAYDTGALAKSVKVKSLKRSRKRIGIAVMPPRGVLFSNYAKDQQKDRQKSGNATFAKPKKDYYPAFVEFGTDTQPAVKPFRRALYDNADVYRAYFKADMTQFIAENKVTNTLAKSSGGYTGRKFRK